MIEDLKHSTRDPGTQVLSVRRDSPISSATEDGNYATFNTDAQGQLYVTDAIADVNAESIIANQESLNTLAQSLQDIGQQLQNLSLIVDPTGSLRVASHPITIASSQTLATVTTLVGQTNIGGYVASMQVMTTMNTPVVLMLNNLTWA